MRILRNRVATVLLAALALVGAGDLTSYAATGHGVLLGKANTADKATTVTRTSKGVALVLKTKAGSAPFGVSSSTKVGKLNADRLDGLDSASLQTRTRSFTDSGAQNRGNSETWTLPVGAGSYLVSYTAPVVLSAGTAAAPETITCDFQTGAAAYALQTGTRTAATVQPFLSGSGTLTVKSGGTLQFSCGASNATTFGLTDGGTFRMDVTRIDGRTVTSVTGS